LCCIIETVKNKKFLEKSSNLQMKKWMDKKDPQYNANWDSYLTQVDEFAKGWIESLKAGMKPKPAAKDDQW